MNDYKNYCRRQMGLTEAQFIPASRLATAARKERGEHPQLSADDAELIAKQHLDKGETEEQISPTARPTPIIALGIRGSSSGGLPSGVDQGRKDISPSKVGGYDRVTPQNLNSKLVDKTPSNPDIKQESTPIVNNPQTGETVTHPHQIQVTAHEEPQAVTGASTDSDPTLKLRSAVPKGIDIDITDEGGAESDEEVKNEDNNLAMIPATSLSETFERHKKLMREKINLTRECTTYGGQIGEDKKTRVCYHCKKSHPCDCDKKDQEDMKFQRDKPEEYRKKFGMKIDKREDLDEIVECKQCHNRFNYRLVSEVAMGAIQCPACDAVLDQSGIVLSEGSSVCQKCKGKGHHEATLKDKSGKNNHGMGNSHTVPCDAPGCHNGTVDKKEYYKGFGIKSADEKELNESKHKAGCQCGFCKNKGSFGKKKKESEEGKETEEEGKEQDETKKQQKLDESYAAPFQRMRSLAGVGNMILTSNGLMENKNDPGASKPFNTNWKMDKEKAGFVKIDEEKLNKVKASLERKSKRGTLSDKELDLAKKLTEVLKRRQSNGAINPSFAAKTLQKNVERGITKKSDVRHLGVSVKQQ